MTHQPLRPAPAPSSTAATLVAIPVTILLLVGVFVLMSHPLLAVGLVLGLLAPRIGRWTNECVRRRSRTRRPETRPTDPVGDG